LADVLGDAGENLARRLRALRRFVQRNPPQGREYVEAVRELGRLEAEAERRLHPGPKDAAEAPPPRTLDEVLAEAVREAEEDRDGEALADEADEGAAGDAVPDADAADDPAAAEPRVTDAPPPRRRIVWRNSYGTIVD